MKKINDTDKKYLILVELLIKKKTDYKANITEIEGKTPSITGLATTTPLSVVEEKKHFQR